MRMFLTAALFAASTTAALACPDWQGEPHYGKITLPQGFSGGELFHTLDVRAGGSSSIADCDIAGYGYVSERPDFDVYWEGETTGIAFSARSTEDTLLLVNAPDGTWHFSDDELEQNPLIFIPNPPQGLYDIWVGTFSSGGLVDATLFVGVEGQSGGGSSKGKN